MKSKLVWIAIAVSAVVGLYLLRRQQEEISNLRQDLETVRELQQDGSRWPAPPRFASAFTVGSSRIAPPSPAPTMAKQPETTTETTTHESRAEAWETDALAYRAAVEEAFVSEQTNLVWADRSRSEISNRITSILPAASLVRQVDCHSSICRVEMTHGTLKALREFTDKALLSRDQRIWNGPTMVMPEGVHPDGTLILVMYLGQEGTDLVKRGN